MAGGNGYRKKKRTVQVQQDCKTADENNKVHHIMTEEQRELSCPIAASYGERNGQKQWEKDRKNIENQRLESSPISW